jgi:hypothetical protein
MVYRAVALADSKFVEWLRFSTGRTGILLAEAVTRRSMKSLMVTVLTDNIAFLMQSEYSYICFWAIAECQSNKQKCTWNVFSYGSEKFVK